MTCRIVFLPDHIEANVPAGTLVSEAAKQAGFFLDAPCGGNGTCGKCGVLRVQNGKTEQILACQTRVTANCSISRIQNASMRSLSEGTVRTVAFTPYAEANRSSKNACFAAFDLGTTTIVCYLLDASNGQQIAVRGMQNPQTAYGADVIARANYALTSGEPLALQKIAIQALNELLAQVCGECNRQTSDVQLVSIVGNTVMHHLLLGYPLERLVRAPYEPHKAERSVLPAKVLGLNVNQKADVLLAPVVGGFVGADTVACLSATAFHSLDEPTLLLDIGTNGELALTDGTKRVCCSTAAGPAFEGANISCGMRAVSGAIDHVWLDCGEFRYSTIGHAPALGLCGSGLIELCALLSNLDLIGESGKFNTDAPFGERLFAQENGTKAFLISQEPTRVFLTQKDVRELQLGKAAMRAGIEVLLRKLSLTAEQISHTLLAGAFGNHLSAQALCDIGLLPYALLGRVESIGNAAGEGAKLYARNYSLFEESETIAQGTQYIELTLVKSFTNFYVDAMAFPREEE
ncbi:MAG: ASKHA domain-containing protein [Eubacteriales bacterium]|nr:ASKHA domain-containing protein [Eubacteriales bacterium]